MSRKKGEKSIKMSLDASKPLDKVRTMNMLAEICRILHADPEVGMLVISIGRPESKGLMEFNFKFK